MKLDSVFPCTAGIADPRARRTVAPQRVITVQGRVRGQEHLAEIKAPQTAICPRPDACILQNTPDSPNAAVLVDFGVELHGSLNLSAWFITPAGGTVDVRIRLGESVGEALTPVGERGTTNDHATRDFVMPVSFLSSNESPESGFRFAWIELLTPDASLEIRAVTATLIFRDLEYVGSFQSSDPLLDQIYYTSAYTVHLNMQRYLWDGIKRDRLVWAGDMNTEINTILAVFGDQCDVVRKSLDFVRDITPPGEAMNTIGGYTMWWLLAHYDHYMATGDHAYLMSQKDYILPMLKKYYKKIAPDGAEMMGGLFDWPSNTHEKKMHAGRQGLMRLALRGGAHLLTYMGESYAAQECFRYVQLLDRHHPSPDGYKQAAAMLALSGAPDAADLVKNVILPDGARGLSTFLGYYTLSAAAEAGEMGAMLDIIREYWGGMLKMGATTFWEDFDVAWTENAHRIDEMPVPGKKDIHGDFGAFCYKNFRHSLCHGWASGPAPVLAKYVLGVRPAAPGFAKAVVCPDAGGLAWVKGCVPTPRGVIEVEIEGGKTKISAPAGIEVIR